MKKLMSANWKMYKTSGEAAATSREMVELISGKLPADRLVLVFPPVTAMAAVADSFAGAPGFFMGAQNFYPAKEGAYTGEISPAMAIDMGAAWALAGHSERRHVFGESDELVGKKMGFGLESGLSMVLCVGEKIEERKEDLVEDVLIRQLTTGFAEVAKDVDRARIAVAYEPVWAIGTGETAGPAEITHAHDFVRVQLIEIFGQTGVEIPILYGGSVKPDNAGEIIGLDNVDGVLVGGASLNADSFSRIVLA